MEDLREEEISITGEYGQEDLCLSLIKLHSVLLIVSLVLKVSLFGRQLSVSQMKTIEATKVNNFHLIKNTIADLVR